MTAMAAIISSCGHANKTVVQDVPKRSMGSPEYRYLYFEGVRQENMGNYDAAYDLFAKALSLDSLAPEAYYSLAVYLADIGKDSLTSAYLEKAVALNPTEDHYYERLAQWYIQTEDYDKAIDVYERLSRTSKNKSEALRILLNLYQQKKDFKKMLSTIDRVEEVDGTSEQITLAKMHIYTMQGDKSSAYTSLKRLVDDHPNDVNYKVMMGNWLEMNDRPDEALEIFKAAENDEPNNEFVEESLYDYYSLHNMDSLMSIYRDKILFNKNASVGTRLSLVQRFVQQNESEGGDSTQVMDLLQRMMQADPENVELAAYDVTYKQYKDMPDEVIEPALLHILDIAPDHSASRLQLVGIKWKKQDWQSIIELCKPALEYNPDEMLFCYFLGLAYYQNDDDDAALEAFRRGVSQINTDSKPEIVSDFYALMGDILHSKGNDKEAYEAYDNCLHWKPDNMSCLNNYAYYLSLGGDEQSLEKAEVMSLKTVTAEPENSTYLDTYAWILFAMERYAEAQVYIDKAILHLEAELNNSTIYEHAGDINQKIGNRAEAVRLWKLALEEGSKNAAEIKRKIKKNEK